MKLMEAFTKRAPNKLFLSMLFGALAGVCYSLLIPIILNSIGSTEGAYGLAKISELAEVFSIKITNYKFATLFIILCIVILVTRTVSQVLLLRIAQDVTTDLRLKLYRRILRAPIDQLDKMGTSRILAIVTGDIGEIVGGAAAIPNLLVNLVTLFGLLGFLLYLDIDVFSVVVIAIVFGAITYQIPMLLGRRYLRLARQHVDDLFEAIRGLIYGTKELKLNKNKRDTYYADILNQCEQNYKRDSKTGQTIVKVGGNYGDLISFVVIGFIAFIFVNYNAINSETLIGIVMALLYVTGPISSIMNSVPQILTAKISLKRVNDFIATMSKEEASNQVVKIPVWDTISFKDLVYKYDDGSNNFELGPISFDVKKGEITFIVGGNGSGKSTLCKLLSLHYPPTSGRIEFGNTSVNNEMINSCREEISAIFTDFYLFDRLLGGFSARDEERIKDFLVRLELNKKVSIENGLISTVQLSDGQRKRLALLVEFLEDRNVYIFDEWAADQDPVFKNVFYNEILPELKEKGKVVIVISHDDRYFSIADKIIVMEEGTLKEIILPSEQGENNSM